MTSAIPVKKRKNVGCGRDFSVALLLGSNRQLSLKFIPIQNEFLSYASTIIHISLAWVISIFHIDYYIINQMSIKSQEFLLQ